MLGNGARAIGGAQAGIGDIAPLCNAQISGSCDARASISLRQRRARVIGLRSSRSTLPEVRCTSVSEKPGKSGPPEIPDAVVRLKRRSIANVEDVLMRILQPADWSKPRGFSHGVAIDGPGCWVVLAGLTGGDEKGEYQADMAGQVTVALRRIIRLLAEAEAGPEHIVRLTWYLTSRSEYQAAGAGIGAAWRETLGKNFPPSTLLYIDGLVDARAKVEIEVTAFVPAA
jgi:enamine deaminase RidA (YjgF/YER057c/UK114 family)